MLEAERLRKNIERGTSRQVKSTDELSLLKATSLTWFNVNRKVLSPPVAEADLKELDAHYTTILNAVTRSTSRTVYLDQLKLIKKALASLEASNVIKLASWKAGTADTPPDFSKLVSDPKMQKILIARWTECVTCVGCNAPLAAFVMMGGLLEGLLLAKINQLSNKSSVFTAAASPKDKKTGTPLPLKDWGLKDFMDVAHELGWISKTAKDIGEVVRDYRNYIHPEKEYVHGITPSSEDAGMLWEVAKTVARQIVK